MEINIAMAISFTVGMLLGGVGGALIICILVGGNLGRVKNERVQNVVYRKKDYLRSWLNLWQTLRRARMKIKTF